jgi:hypothetical protein
MSIVLELVRDGLALIGLVLLLIIRYAVLDMRKSERKIK